MTLLSLQERDSAAAAAALDSHGGEDDEGTRRGRAAGRAASEAEDEASGVKKLQRMVNKPLAHVPSLALDEPLSEDGVHLRPCHNDLDHDHDAGRDPSPDRNDSDNLSAYEDASAETPEQDRLFPGDGDTLELPHDSENKEKCLCGDDGDNGESQDPKNCVVS